MLKRAIKVLVVVVVVVVVCYCTRCSPSKKLRVHLKRQEEKAKIALEVGLPIVRQTDRQVGNITSRYLQVQASL